MSKPSRITPDAPTRFLAISDGHVSLAKPYRWQRIHQVVGRACQIMERFDAVVIAGDGALGYDNAYSKYFIQGLLVELSSDALTLCGYDFMLDVRTNEASFPLML